jgi:hypothetical protein
VPGAAITAQFPAKQLGRSRRISPKKDVFSTSAAEKCQEEQAG